MSENLTRDALYRRMLQASLDSRSKTYDCFVCVLMSHGLLDGIYCSDGDILDLPDVFNLFKKCSAWVGKPKLFFVQACRGQNPDMGNRVHHDAEDGSEVGLMMLSWQLL